MGNLMYVALRECKTDEEKKKLILQCLERKANAAEEDRQIVDDFKQGLEWFNTSEPLSLQGNLKGKLVILDFFTYCCINCMHILPDLEAIEEKFPVEDGVAVVGVHSAKFDNEKSSANVLNAVLRYNISHPVVNDGDLFMWDELKIQCWPTLLFVSPTGDYLVPLMGEGNRDLSIMIIEVALDFYKSRGEISNHSLPLELSKDSLPRSLLLYPGKIETNPEGDVIAVADSGHHRILVLSREGVVEHCVGGMDIGYKDGSFEEAQFHSPQGMTWRNGDLFVADTENHVIRKIDFKKNEVTTIAGTGKQLDGKVGGGRWTDQELSSPWDLTFGGPNQNIMFIAMAGTHTIWGLFMEEGTWLKDIYHRDGTCMAYAGSGKEENKNNSYPHKAAFAQPSGISAANEDALNCLFLADSESSTVRTISFKDGAVKALVGGERDPMNLYAFGDVDGKGYDVKLQHPLGVAWNSHDQRLYVADSYNHKIKSIEPLTKTCTSVAGCGEPGKVDGALLDVVQFNEPGGLCVAPDGKTIFIADTNSNAIRVLDLQTQSVQELKVIFPTKSSSTSVSAKKLKSLISSNSPVITLDSIEVTPGSEVSLNLLVDLPEGCNLTEGAPTAWQVYAQDSTTKDPIPSFNSHHAQLATLETTSSTTVSIPDNLADTKANLRAEADIYFCEKVSGTCHRKGVAFEIPVQVGSIGQTSNESRSLDLKYSFEL